MPRVGFESEFTGKIGNEESWQGKFVEELNTLGGGIYLEYANKSKDKGRTNL